MYMWSLPLPQAVKVPASEEQANVPDLEEGEQYEFRVRANTEAGPPGKPSTPTPAVTAEDRPGKEKNPNGNLTPSMQW